MEFPDQHLPDSLLLTSEAAGAMSSMTLRSQNFPMVRTIWWHPGCGKMPGSLPSRHGSNVQELGHILAGVSLWHQPCGYSCAGNNRMEGMRANCLGGSWGGWMGSFAG